jgi:hypothetical protein
LLWRSGCHDTQELLRWSLNSLGPAATKTRQTSDRGWPCRACVPLEAEGGKRGSRRAVDTVGRWLVCGLLCESRWGWVVGGPKGFDAHAGRGSAGLPVRLSRGFQGREKGAGRNAAEIIRRTCTAVCRQNGNYHIRQSSRWQIKCPSSRAVNPGCPAVELARSQLQVETGWKPWWNSTIGGDVDSASVRPRCGISRPQIHHLSACLSLAHKRQSLSKQDMAPINVVSERPAVAQRRVARQVHDEWVKRPLRQQLEKAAAPISGRWWGRFGAEQGKVESWNPGCNVEKPNNPGSCLLGAPAGGLMNGT